MTDFGNHINGIHKIIIKGERGQAAMEEQARSEEAKMNFRSESYRRAFKTFKNQNWNPSIVIGHTGWGCGIYVKEVWPQTKFIGYVEWWFKTDSEIAKESKTNRFLGYNEIVQIKLWNRNKNIGLELLNSDKIVAPTHWQKLQLPETIQSRCTIVRDGIKLKDFAKPEEIKSESIEPIITYGTRGMEPIRCFKEFVKSIPLIIEKNPNTTIEIAGEDIVCYGG